MLNRIITLILSLGVAIGAQTTAPELPRVYLQSTLPAVTGRSYRVSVSGLQAALTIVLPGDEIVVTGSASLYMLPVYAVLNKRNRTSADVELLG